MKEKLQAALVALSQWTIIILWLCSVAGGFHHFLMFSGLVKR